MDAKEISQQIVDMAVDRDLEEFTPHELAGVLMEVLMSHHDELPALAVTSLLFVSACLLRDHSVAVEKDILAVWEIYRRPS